jgi:hypothetical protein
MQTQATSTSFNNDYFVLHTQDRCRPSKEDMDRLVRPDFGISCKDKRASSEEKNDKVRRGVVLRTSANTKASNSFKSDYFVLHTQDR